MEDKYISPSTDSYIQITSWVKGYEPTNACSPVWCNLIEVGDIFINDQKEQMSLLAVQIEKESKFIKEIFTNEIHFFITANLDKSWKVTKPLESIVDIKFGDLYGKGINSVFALASTGKVYCFDMHKYERDFWEAIKNLRFWYEGNQNMFLSKQFDTWNPEEMEEEDLRRKIEIEQMFDPNIEEKQRPHHHLKANPPSLEQPH